MFPAARLSDMHVCPMFTGPVPHVGGPVIAVGPVLTCFLPQAKMGDKAICVGPPDSILMGSTTVLVQNKPAARLTSSCAHGGLVVAGAPTVLIGG